MSPIWSSLIIGAIGSSSFKYTLQRHTFCGLGADASDAGLAPCAVEAAPDFLGCARPEGIQGDIVMLPQVALAPKSYLAGATSLVWQDLGQTEDQSIKPLTPIDSELAKSPL